MRSIAARRIDRMLSAQPLPLTAVNKISLKYATDNECATYFAKELLPLMAYGNKHIEFNAAAAESGEKQYCSVLLSSGSNVTLNLKLYRYPLQIMQRIVDVAATQEESSN
ncbi:hypothetical protein BBBOND_0104030 [Babesia bigemina]|uniref:Uncharacterized protein n=1 Tax=Babesia bigemina TaxID=5866 RepID=A0A061D8L9_BABBI|nr:hypothetical protein BBBOND_0104030 [Babesia bigemina]CDR94095.1 hypothetical protein BBBOND_0104030 [Babesia bigemina]|eukprot:XP_012766281.1 hypothetical protein BBBOND_0104030 [Babesia bigemina]